LTVGLLAAAMPSMALATTPNYVYITGSTAFRAAATVGIIAQLGGTSCREEYYGNSTNGKAIFQIFANGTIGGSGTATTVVLTQWTGALAGPIDLASQNTSENFINPNDATVISNMNSSGALCTSQTGGGFAGGYYSSAAPAVTPHAPNAAFSDEFQSSAAASVATCPSISPAIVVNSVPVTSGPQLAKIINNTAFVDAGTVANSAGTVGVIPFEWILGNYAGYTGSNAPFTNMTQQTAHALMDVGYAPVAFFNPPGTYSGSPTADWVYFISRSEDSGTRINCLAEPQNGFGQPVLTYLATFSNNQKTTGALPQPTYGVQVGGTGATTQELQLWPANGPMNTEPNINWNALGHSGFVSGGDVANVLSANLPAAVNTTGTVNNGSSVYIPAAYWPSENTGQPYLVGYIGIADAGGNIASGVTHGTALTYNGVAYSPAAVLSGAYSMWSFEHLWYIDGQTFGQVGSAQKTFLDTLADNLFNTYAPSDSSGVLNPASGDGAGIIYNPAAGAYKIVEGGIMGVNY
jgi:hypothetical protein